MPYYKVVSERSGKLYSAQHKSDSYPRESVLEYAPGKVTTAIIGKLLCFSSLESADGFTKITDRPQIWTCQVWFPKEQEYLLLDSKENLTVENMKVFWEHPWKMTGKFHYMRVDAVTSRSIRLLKLIWRGR